MRPFSCVRLCALVCRCVYVVYKLCAIVYDCVLLCTIASTMMRRREYMTKGNAYGMAILRRFLLDEIVDTYIRPRLLDTFPFWRISDGRISLHVHRHNTWHCCSHKDIFFQIRRHYETAPIVSTQIDVFVYNERIFDHTIHMCGELDQIERRLRWDNPRVHSVWRRDIYPLPLQ